MAAADARRSRNAAEEVQREMRIQAERVDTLILACTALWSLLQECTGLTEDDLARRMQEIDLADGVANGKITPTANVCANCGRKISRRHRKCLFCGSDQLSETPFEGL